MLKILIVDDDLVVLRSLGTTFTTLLRGYLMLTATTANQGLNLIKEQKPELIIMDVRLGPDSGMDLLEDYPEYTRDYHPRMIVITAYKDERAEKRAKELKVDAYLRKPFSQEALLDAVLGSIENYHESELRNVRFARQALRRKQASLGEAKDDLKREKKPSEENP